MSVNFNIIENLNETLSKMEEVSIW